MGKVNPNDAKNYSSTLRSSYIDPVTTEEYKTAQRSDIGPREKLLLNQIRNNVESDYKAKKAAAYESDRKVDYKSTSHHSYNKDNFTPSLVNHPNSRIPTGATDYSYEPAITYYYDELMNNSDTRSINFPVSFTTSANPFRKNSAFSSKPWIDPSTKKCETNERPVRAPTFVEFKTLHSFRNRLIAHVTMLLKDENKVNKGLALGAIATSLWNASDMIQSDLLPIDDVIYTLQNNFKFNVTTAERHAFLSAFDYDCTERITITELNSFIRGTFSPRRLEIVGVLYSALQNVSVDGIVTSDVITNYYNHASADTIGSVDYVIASLVGSISHDNKQEITFDDFAEYYTNVSGEIGVENDDFESYVKKQFQSIILC